MQPQKQPELQKTPQAQQANKKRSKAHTSHALDGKQKQKFWLTALTIGVIGFGGWWLWPPTAPDADNISQDEINRIQAEYQQINELAVERITNPTEALEAIKAMNLSPEEKAQLEQKVENGEMDMAWIQALDNAAEDGDILQFESGGFKAKVTLVNAPAIFALPLAPGQNQVKVTGVHDGGGGITASVVTSTGATSVPVIQTGQSYFMPLR